MPIIDLMGVLTPNAKGWKFCSQGIMSKLQGISASMVYVDEVADVPDIDKLFEILYKMKRLPKT